MSSSGLHWLFVNKFNSIQSRSLNNVVVLKRHRSASKIAKELLEKIVFLKQTWMIFFFLVFLTEKMYSWLKRKFIFAQTFLKLWSLDLGHLGDFPQRGKHGAFSKILQFCLRFVRTGNKFLTDQHWAAARCLPTTVVDQRVKGGAISIPLQNKNLPCCTQVKIRQRFVCNVQKVIEPCFIFVFKCLGLKQCLLFLRKC